MGNVALSDAVLTQHWLYHADLRLELYAEASGTEPFASVLLTIITEQSPDDELAYSGTYNLKIEMPEPLADGNANIIEQTGKVSCSVG